MYIKLTRLDNFNTPIWLNAAFVVTVEPRKGGGSIVVPIGDGFDYDVRETPEQVLALLGDAPTPTVVPVPAPKSLTPTPEDVSPEPEQRALPSQVAEEKPADEPKPAKRMTRKARPKAAADGEGVPKRTVRSRVKKPSANDVPSAEANLPTPAEEKTTVEFSEEQVSRLKKMMPGSVQKLLNTLKAQFKVSDAEAVVASLKTGGVITIEQDHVIWK